MHNKRYFIAFDFNFSILFLNSVSTTQLADKVEKAVLEAFEASLAKAQLI